MNTEKIFDAIDRDWEVHLDRYRRYMRQPSVSGTGEGVRDMAALLIEEFKDLGCQETLLVETPGWPVAYGSLDVGAEKTMLLYGMYDVQPVVGEDWRVPPFSGDITEEPGIGEVMMSRGICNQKGPFASLMNALWAIKEQEGTLPVNVKFVIEGEEEMASEHLPGAIEVLRSRLEGCDFCYFPHFSQDRDGGVKQYLGTKGVMFIELTCKGGDWGAPVGGSIHGSNAIWMDNPVWTLVHVLKTLKDENEKVLIEGFYDDVAGPLDGDEAIVDELVKSFDPEAYLRNNDVRRYKLGLEGKDLLRRYFYSPELNIDGIAGGYCGEGTKTLLPNEAVVRLDIRTVPNLEPQKLIELFKRHLTKLGVDDRIEARYISAYNWSRSKIDEPAVQALIAAEREMGYPVEPWVTLAGSAPFSLFQSMLGLPIAFGGLGHGGRVHSPNEYATVKGLKDMEKCIVLFLRNISAG